MKAAFSTAWKSSVQPRKQRKYVHNASLHTKSRLLSVHLSKELAKKYSTRSVRVRVGDKVKVLRGTHKGKEGKVERVDLTNLRVYVAKIATKKLDGTTSQYPLRPSNLLITAVVDDKRRFSKSKESKSTNKAEKTPIKQATKTAPKTTEKTTEKKATDKPKKVVKKVVKKE